MLHEVGGGFKREVYNNGCLDMYDIPAHVCNGAKFSTNSSTRSFRCAQLGMLQVSCCWCNPMRNLSLVQCFRFVHLCCCFCRKCLLEIDERVRILEQKKFPLSRKEISERSSNGLCSSCTSLVHDCINYK